MFYCNIITQLPWIIPSDYNFICIDSTGGIFNSITGVEGSRDKTYFVIYLYKYMCIYLLHLLLACLMYQY